VTEPHAQPSTHPEDSADVRAWMERRFLTVVSHQLKSPLVAVRQYLDLLQDDAAARPEAAHTRPWIDRSIVRLEEALAIVEDWLALARVEAGALIHPDARTDLAALLAELVADARDAAATSRVGVRLEAPEVPLEVRGDRSSLAAALSHVVDNAIRYNHPGGAVVVRCLPPCAEQPGLARVEVEDTGIGIPRSFLPQLFQEFHRARSAASRDIPGTGLGLAISQRIVQELGGHIAVESVEGEGSTFRLFLPLAG
jgi:signal transduction histidine kinase